MTPQDAQDLLTRYLLGDLDGPTTAAVEELMKLNPELLSECNALRPTVELLRQALEPETVQEAPPAKLSAERRQRILRESIEPTAPPSPTPPRSRRAEQSANTARRGPFWIFANHPALAAAASIVVMLGIISLFLPAAARRLSPKSERMAAANANVEDLGVVTVTLGTDLDGDGLSDDFATGANEVDRLKLARPNDDDGRLGELKAMQEELGRAHDELAAKEVTTAELKHRLNRQSQRMEPLAEPEPPPRPMAERTLTAPDPQVTDSRIMDFKRDGDGGEKAWAFSGNGSDNFVAHVAPPNARQPTKQPQSLDSVDMTKSPVILKGVSGSRFSGARGGQLKHVDGWKRDDDSELTKPEFAGTPSARSGTAPTPAESPQRGLAEQKHFGSFYFGYFDGDHGGGEQDVNGRTELSFQGGTADSPAWTAEGGRVVPAETADDYTFSPEIKAGRRTTTIAGKAIASADATVDHQGKRETAGSLSVYGLDLNPDRDYFIDALPGGTGGDANGPRDPKNAPEYGVAAAESRALASLLDEERYENVAELRQRENANSVDSPDTGELRKEAQLGMEKSRIGVLDEASKELDGTRKDMNADVRHGWESSESGSQMQKKLTEDQKSAGKRKPSKQMLAKASMVSPPLPMVNVGYPAESTDELLIPSEDPFGDGESLKITNSSTIMEKTKEAGITWPEGSGIEYRGDMLTIHNTKENAEAIARFLQRGQQKRQEEEAREQARFKAHGVNPFINVTRNPFSTFAIDVDTASYTMARRYLRAGFLPPAEAVRTEEFVNFFDYHYKPPQHRTFRVYTEAAPSRFGRGMHMLKVAIKGRRLGREEQRRAVLTFLVDTSGSMDKPERIGLIKQSLEMLVKRLNPEDRVAIVQYGSHARIVLPHTAASEAKRILAALDALQCGGATNLEEGMRRAYELASSTFVPGGENRVLLLSDGVANLGSGEADQILRSVERFRRQGITCSVFGFGVGSYDDEMLESLANRGDGQYAYIDGIEEATRIFVDDLSATLNTIAADVKIQVEFDPRRVQRYRQLGYENRQLTKEQFRDDTVDAGEVGSGQSVTALYELELHGSPRDPIGIVRVRYRRLDTGAVEETEHAVTAADLAPQFNQATVGFRLAACVAEFSEILRASPFAQGSRCSDLATVLAPIVLERNLDEHSQELLRLVQGADGMSRGEYGL